MMRRLLLIGLFSSVLIAPLTVPAPRQLRAESLPAHLGTDFGQTVLPMLTRHCNACHSGAKVEADIDLGEFKSLADVRKTPRTWQKVLEMIESGQMPPKNAKVQPTDDERRQLQTWVRSYLKAEARNLAGDPGPVVLRRLNNVEYTNTVADLTGVDLKPAREFPADSAAGEGFTNTGNALVMSPALLAKYLDAGKDIARHAVLLPDGIRFSPSTSRRDWTNEVLDQIRTLYRQYSDAQGGTRVNLQGIVFDTNDGGRLPLERYLAATLAERAAWQAGTKTIAAVAKERGLSSKYLTLLWQTLNESDSSALLDLVRTRWKNAKPGDEKALATEINVWQNALMRFQSVGHMKSWMVPVSPLGTTREIRMRLAAPAKGNDIVLYLVSGDAGDGDAGDIAVWQRPRLVIPGRADLPLRDVRDFAAEIVERRASAFAASGKCLLAAAEAMASGATVDAAALAKKHGVPADDLSAWLSYLGIGASAAPKLDYLTKTISSSGGYDFVKGWGTPDTPLLVANSSDRHVRIPGNIKGRGVCVHPSPTLNVAVGWRSPVTGQVAIDGMVTHAHPECGNGVVWSLELRRGATRQRLASGTAQGGRGVKVGPFDKIAVQKGDLISLVVGPRDGNHACDLTDLELTVKSAEPEKREWSLTKDVSGNVLAGNPQNDSYLNKDVWHFYIEAVKQGEPVVPAGSVLSRWLVARPGAEQNQLAEGVQKLLTTGPPTDAANPDAVLYRQLASLGGPLLAKFQITRLAKGGDNQPGLGREWFGRHPQGIAVDPTTLCVRAPAVLEVRLPADLFAGAEFVATGVLRSKGDTDGSVQMQVVTTKPVSAVGLRIEAPVIVAENSAAKKRWEQAFEAFRQLFPAALCYTKIVPVDEVVTLTLYHREDEHLSRLMLNDQEKAKLDRLWHELHFVSHDALTLVDAFNQLMEYATQDSNPKLFEPYRQPIMDRASAFRKELVDVQPRHLEAVIQFAGRAYRRPLAESEATELRNLYGKLRAQEMPHEDAIRLTLARVLVAPSFLYRLEKSPPGTKPGPVSDWELATRLSYFLTATMPDEQLCAVAASGKLADADTLVVQTNRLLKDARVRRLATEFACHWLHIHGFDTLDEKSERHFPEFVKLRGDMYEESIRFFTDLFQRDGSILSILDADHTFVNEALAKHYGIPNVSGPEWRRVDGVRKLGRGGILGQATTLAKQSGASRTSPILRGVWISETILGEKLPKPPKDVPQLPEDEADSGKSVRQLVEKHSSDARCAVCHARIDPYGFALEGYDAIGRKRTKDLGGRPIETHAKLKDGIEFDGLDGLRNYLLTKRRDTFVQQFCRKLLGYALGRGVQLSDEPLIEEMQQTLEKNGYRVSIAIEAIVRSPQFREIRGREFVVKD